ncbi:MAG: succinate dehydrogenase cytochrome b subunit [Pseudomonadota bacterium]|jgi:succinate dehydrogenase / fumarate reductase cytochrome b subunit
MSLFTSSVGRKVLMAVSGFFLLGFIVAHLAGNSTIFAGSDWLNAYAEHLHELGPLVWVFRVFMIVVLLAHIFFGVLLTLENWGANPGKYAVRQKLKVTFSSRTMIWTGLLLLVFIAAHIAQFTLRMTPDIVLKADEVGRFDVYTMVVSSLRVTGIAAAYIFGMVILFLHTRHGIQSFLQSLGLSNDMLQPKYTLAGKVISAIFLLGYGAIPVLALTGILAR